MTSLLGGLGWRWLAIPVALGLALGAGLAFVRVVQPVYQADALLYVDVNANPQAVQAADGLLTQSYVQLVTSARTLDRASASKTLDRPAERAELQRAITATIQKGTNTIAVTAHARDPHRAAMLANVTAQATVDQNRFDGQNRLTASIALAKDQLKQIDASLAQLRFLPADDLRAGQSAALQAQYAAIYGRLLDLQLAKSQIADALSIVQEAGVPVRPVTPDPPLDIAVALGIGLIVGVLGVVVLGRMDARLSSLEALTRVVGPSVQVSSPARFGDPSSFAVAQAALEARFPNATRMLVASAGPGSAALEVARGLAEASRVRTGEVVVAMAGAATERSLKGSRDAATQRARRRTDAVIVVIPDAAKADASALAETAPCEVSVLVAESGVTTSSQARRAIRALQSAGFQPTAAILLGNAT